MKIIASVIVMITFLAACETDTMEMEEGMMGEEGMMEDEMMEEGMMEEEMMEGG